MYTKTNISADDIKANIYNNIRFIVDIQGASTDGVEKSDIAISSLLNSEVFNRIEDSFTYDEINEWDKRNHRTISNRMKQRLIETEKVIRYISKDKTEIIILSKNYIELKLIYEKSFVLKERMELLQNIVKQYDLNNPFMQVDNLTLIKNNVILCKSLYMLYRCFNARQFGDIKSGLSYQKAFFAGYDSSAEIIMDEYNLVVQKAIAAGTYEKKLAYMGKLNFIISYSNHKNIEKLDIKNILTDMNSCLFDIFVSHLTIPFLNDLVNGSTNKVIGGFKLNE